MATVSLTLSVREIEVLHTMLSQGLTVADMIVNIDDTIASDIQPQAGQAKNERLALLRVISAVRTAATPQASPRLDGKNAAR